VANTEELNCQQDKRGGYWYAAQPDSLTSENKEENANDGEDSKEGSGENEEGDEGEDEVVEGENKRGSGEKAIDGVEEGEAVEDKTAFEAARGAHDLLDASQEERGDDLARKQR
jgi:hypothetical protein